MRVASDHAARTRVLGLGAARSTVTFSAQQKGQDSHHFPFSMAICFFSTIFRHIHLLDVQKPMGFDSEVQ